MAGAELGGAAGTVLVTEAVVEVLVEAGAVVGGGTGGVVAVPVLVVVVVVVVGGVELVGGLLLGGALLVVGAERVGRVVVRPGWLELLRLVREVRCGCTGTAPGAVLPVNVGAEVGGPVGAAEATAATPDEGSVVADPASAADPADGGVPSSVEGINPFVAATAGPPTSMASATPPRTGRRRYSGRGPRCLPM